MAFSTIENKEPNRPWLQSSQGLFWTCARSAQCPNRSKEYQGIRNRLVLAGLILTFVLFFLLFSFDLSRWFFELSGSGHSRYFRLLLYFLALSAYFFICGIPLRIYSGFVLEHRYQLSNQNFQGWLLDEVKKELISFLFSAVLVTGLYWMIWRFPSGWWIGTWVGYTLVSIILGKLFPVLVVPLFYRYKPIAEGPLKQRILALASRFGMNVENIYSLNLSKTTKKANAMFCGLGKTKRVVLADTLLDRFTDDEIEVVTAHELGHFVNRDIWRHLGFGMLTSAVIFWLSFRTVLYLEPSFGLNGAEDIQAMPILFFIFFLASLFLTPLSHAYSRWRERLADLFALKTLSSKGAFISTMEKLSETNLADPNPHPLIEFLLYDHPSIQKRISMARDFTA